MVGKIPEVSGLDCVCWTIARSGGEELGFGFVEKGVVF